MTRRRPTTAEHETVTADLIAKLAEAEQRAHQTARIMYRRGYLAGHSAGRKGARRINGPTRKTRDLIG